MFRHNMKAVCNELESVTGRSRADDFTESEYAVRRLPRPLLMDCNKIVSSGRPSARTFVEPFRWERRSLHGRDYR